MGRSSLRQIASVLIFLSSFCFLSVSQAADKIHKLPNPSELAEIISNSPSPEAAIKEVSRLYDEFDVILLNFNSGIFETLDQLKSLELHVLNNISEAKTSNNPVIRSTVDLYLSQLRDIRDKSNRMNDIMERINQSRSAISKRKEAAFISIQLARYERLLTIIEQDYNVMIDAIYQIEEMQLERFDIIVPGVLDCPGPACPLSS